MSYLVPSLPDNLRTRSWPWPSHFTP